MPVSRYFKGHGAEVMADMTRRYGPERGKRVFYATANKKKGMAPKKRGMKAHLMDLKAKGHFRKNKAKY